MTEDNKQDDEATEVEIENKNEQEEKDNEEGNKNQDSKEQNEEEKEDYKEKWLRAQADYRNLKKEMSEKRDEWRERITFQVLQEFIPVFDNFKKAYDHKPKEDDEDLKQWKNWAQGMEFILKQFNDILDDYDIQTIKAEGEEFKPSIHDAIEKKFSNELKEGAIMEVMEQGYKTEDKVLKPAKVVVSKGPEEGSGSKEDDSGENKSEDSQ